MDNVQKHNTCNTCKLPFVVHLFTHILQFKISVFWDIMPSGLVDIYQCFGGTSETICRTEKVPLKHMYLSTKSGLYNTEDSNLDTQPYPV
jgi:hypothetical protein